MGTATGIIRALNSGIKHIAVKRFTLRYPEEKLKFVGDGYQFDPTTGVGIAGYKGRHMLFHDKCTGCQLCSIACEGVAEAIAMVKVPEEQKQNIAERLMTFIGVRSDEKEAFRKEFDKNYRSRKLSM